MNSFHVFPVLFCAVLCAPNLRIIPDNLRPPQLLTLPSNATSIRNDISDSFSCEGRSYGYYADVENDCQLFHVCLPMKYQDGRTQMFRWSFICPEETVFNQELFTCTRSDESLIDCAESPRFYDLNRNFGSAEIEATGTESSSGLEEEPQEAPIEVMQSIGRTKHRKD